MTNPFDAIGEAISNVLGKIIEAIAGEMINAFVQGLIDGIFGQKKSDDAAEPEADA